MATYLFALFFIFVSTAFYGVHADGLDDILGSRGDSTFDDLDGFPRMTGLGRHRRPSYSLSSYRSHNKGFSFGGSRGQIYRRRQPLFRRRGLPDLVNLVFGLGGHVVGTAGSIVHDAVQSLFGGLFPPKRTPLFPGLFGHGRDRDDRYDDRSLGFGRSFDRDDRYDDRGFGFGRRSGRDDLFDDRDGGFGGLSDDVFGGLDF